MDVDVFDIIANRARRIWRRAPYLNASTAMGAALLTTPARYSDLPCFVGRMTRRDGKVALWPVGGVEMWRLCCGAPLSLP